MRRAPLALFALVFAQAAVSGEFGSVAVDGAVLFDAPSKEARKLFVLSRFYPVEIIVDLDRWAKVRDAAGGLAWMDKAQLSERRMVLVTAPLLDVRRAPVADAPLVFQAEKDVVLELLGLEAGGWAKVRHRDGATGFALAKDLWGL